MNPTLDKNYRGWIKGRLALKYLRECLVQCADEVSKEEHNRILQNICLTPGSSCNICDLKTLKPKHTRRFFTRRCPFDQSNCNCLCSNTRRCPNNICDRIYEEIIALRGQRQLYWDSTDITQWTTNPWEITKCYIDDPGYKGKSASDTDLLVLMQWLRSSQLLDNVEKEIQSEKIQDLMNIILHHKESEFFNDKTTSKAGFMILFLLEMLGKILKMLQQGKTKERIEGAVTKLEDLNRRSFIITTNIEMEVCFAELANVIKKIEEIESRKEQEKFNPETCKDVLDKQTQALSTIHDPSVTRDLLSRNSIITRKIKSVLELTKQDDLWALFEDTGIVEASEETSLTTPTEQIKNGVSDWEFYATCGDELALFYLMRKKEFIPNPQQLTQACKRFGRKSRIIRIICNLICKFIKASVQETITVWPAYSEQNTHDITFVIVLLDKNSAKKFSDINVLYWNPEHSGFEHRDVIRKTVDSNIRIDDGIMNLMKLAINSHSELLRNMHSNIKAITGSPMRSLGYKKGTHETKMENCIVLLVPIKGLIPLQEDAFPKQIGTFKIDVREGSFKWCVGGRPSDMHTDLKMGCAIGPAERDVIGTLGGFVSHPEHGLCALTCAHVLMEEEEIMTNANIAGRRCVQPSNTSWEYGNVVKTIFRDDGPDKPGLDIALIKINNRAPIMGYFPDIDLGTLEKAGFSEINEIKYTSGKILSRIADRDSRVVKYGSRTTLRRGVLGFKGMELAYRPVRYSREIVLKNQIEILDITRCGPFAEPGDSGSLVFVVSGNELVALGLLLGGDDGYAVVTPILDVLRAIQCDSMKEFSEMAVSHSDSGVYSDDREEMEVDTEDGHDKLYNRLSRLNLQSTADV